MLLRILNAKNPLYDAETWTRYDALYKGGKAFRDQIGKFLVQNDLEPHIVYERRKREAYYRSYVGPIVDFFAAQLFATTPAIRTKSDGDETVEPDEFYARFKEDVDGDGCDLVDFMRARFAEALTKRMSWWRVELPSNDGAAPTDRAEWAERKLGEAWISPLQAEQVLDWECDDMGRLEWAIVHSRETPRSDPRVPRGIVRETWRLFDREQVETFQIEYDPAQRKPDADDDIPSVGVEKHGFTRVPLVCMHVPEGLWLLNRVADAQVEHFRVSSAMGWAIRRTAFSMPVFKLTDRQSPPTMGTGYYVMIGEKEDMTWSAPPSTPFDVMAAEAAAQKDEIYRVAQQMALGVDNNAAAVGRSADSKAQDSSATEVCLMAYGAVAREAIEKTYDIISDGRGERDLRWSIEGLDRFNLADAQAVVQNATAAQLLSVPSRTFRKELMVQVADALLPRVDQQTKDTIREEIDEGVESEGDMQDVMGEAEHDARIKTLEVAPAEAKAKADKAKARLAPS